jgi:hypothetical protein
MLSDCWRIDRSVTRRLWLERGVLLPALPLLGLAGCHGGGSKPAALYTQEIQDPAPVESIRDLEAPAGKPVLFPLAKGSLKLELSAGGSAVIQSVRGGWRLSEIRGECARIDVITPPLYFGIQGTRVDFGDAGQEGGIHLRKPDAVRLDSDRKRYVILESAVDSKDALRATVVQVLPSTGITECRLPRVIELPQLTWNGRVTTVKKAADAVSPAELLYYCQKARAFPAVDALFRRVSALIGGLKTTVQTAGGTISAETYARQFVAGQPGGGSSQSLEGLPAALWSVIQSVKAGQEKLTDVQWKAFFLSGLLYWEIACDPPVYSDEGGTQLVAPRISVEPGRIAIQANRELLGNILFAYWVTKNPSLLQVQNEELARAAFIGAK